MPRSPAPAPRATRCWRRTSTTCRRKVDGRELDRSSCRPRPTARNGRETALRPASYSPETMPNVFLAGWRVATLLFIGLVLLAAPRPASAQSDEIQVYDGGLAPVGVFN